MADLDDFLIVHMTFARVNSVRGNVVNDSVEEKGEADTKEIKTEEGEIEAGTKEGRRREVFTGGGEEDVDGREELVVGSWVS